MAKVKATKLTENEKQNLKTWYCQTCGGELDEQRSDDPTRSLKCGACGDSWWATDPPSADDVDERQAAIKRAEETTAARRKAAERSVKT